MRRGDIVIVASAGDYGKPRPAIVVQSNRILDVDSIILCPCTTTERDVPLFRLAVEASPSTGLREPSQIMVEKIRSVRRERCGPVIGSLDAGTLVALDEMLAFVIGLADRPR